MKNNVPKITTFKRFSTINYRSTYYCWKLRLTFTLIHMKCEDIKTFIPYDYSAHS